MIDNPYQAPTPMSESIVSGVLQIAGFWRRAFAFALDLILLRIFYFVSVVFVIKLNLITSDSGDKMFEASKVVLTGAYFLYANAGTGMTPGKWIMRIRVCRINGLPLNFGIGFMRTLPAVVFCATWLMIFILSDPPGWTIYAPLGQEPESIRAHRMSIVNTFMVIYAFSALVCVLLTKRKQSLHDLLAGTIVVKRCGSTEADGLSDT